MGEVDPRPMEAVGEKGKPGAVGEVEGRSWGRWPLGAVVAVLGERGRPREAMGPWGGQEQWEAGGGRGERGVPAEAEGGA